MSRESVLALGCAEIDTNFPLSAAQGATNRVAVWQTGSVADLEIGHTAANVGPRSMVGPLETRHLLRLTRSENRLTDDSLWARWTSSTPFAEDFFGVLFGRNVLAKRSPPRNRSERESFFLNLNKTRDRFKRSRLLKTSRSEDRTIHDYIPGHDLEQQFTSAGVTTVFIAKRKEQKTLKRTSRPWNTFIAVLNA